MTAPALSRPPEDADHGVIWRPGSPYQVRVLRSRVFEAYIGGGKGASKTDLNLIGSLRQVAKARYRALILRQTFGETADLIERMRRWGAAMPARDRPAWNGSERVLRWPSGAQTHFGYCRTIEDAQQYMGREWSYIGFDEQGNLRDRRIPDTLIADIRSPDPSIVLQYRGTGNWGMPGHAWNKARYYDTCGKRGERIYWQTLTLPNGEVVRLSRGFFPGTVWDNPVYSRSAQYLGQLMSLPEKERRQKLFGDAEALGGLALDELDARVHLVDAFPLPPNWELVAGYDWGFAHPFGLCWGAYDLDGTLWVADTITGHRKKDHEQAQQIARMAPRLVQESVRIRAGRDAFSQQEAHAAGTIPSAADRMRPYGVHLVRANDRDAAAGLRNLRHYTAWRGLGRNGADARPRLRIMRTPGNMKLWEQITSIVEDPDDPEVAKTEDADPETGEGGDDLLHALRNMAIIRPVIDLEPAESEADEFSAFDPVVLEHEAAVQRRVRRPPLPDERTNPNLDLPGELAG